MGVELAGDIKDSYSEKKVTLIHSREDLMNNFGKILKRHTLNALRNELGVRVVLKERPKLPGAGSMVQCATLSFSDGHKEDFDLIVSHLSRSEIAFCVR